MSALAAPNSPPPKKPLAKAQDHGQVTVVWRRRPPSASKRPAPKLHERDDSV